MWILGLKGSKPTQILAYSEMNYLIIIIMSLFRPLKYITNVTESKSIQIMKVAPIVHNYYIKPDKTLDIYIVKLSSCIEALFY